MTLARSVDPTLGFVPTYNYATVKLSNTGDQLGLSCNTVLIDHVSFAVVTKGQSLSLDPRHFSAVDNDNPANWCLATVPYNMLAGSTDSGSPNAVNPLCP